MSEEKLDYDPSNKLDEWVTENARNYQIERKVAGGSWEVLKLGEDYDIRLESGESEMSDRGSRSKQYTYIFEVFYKRDKQGNEYEFGFTSQLPQTTYIDEDVGGGKKLSVDYDVVEQLKAS